MIKYLFKRLLYFLPTLIVISMVAFGLSRSRPGAQIEKFCGGDPQDPLSGNVDPVRAANEYKNCAEKLGLDKPLFYFSFTSSAYPDTLYRILNRSRRETLKRLIAQFGNWPEIQNYYSKLTTVQASLPKVRSLEAKDIIIDIKGSLRVLYGTHESPVIKSNLDSLFQKTDLLEKQDSSIELGSFEDKILQLKAAFREMEQNASPYRLYIPVVYWNGFSNQYHNWFFRFFTGDFGVSLIDQQSVSNKIFKALRWTLMINFSALFLALFISIGLGVYVGGRKGTFIDHLTSFGLFTLYSLPTFWIATLLVVFLTTKEYGVWLDMFPTGGLYSLEESAPFWNRFWDVVHHLVLPVFCLTYPALAFISRQVRSNMIEVLKMDFVKAARAKGLSAKRVVWQHAFKNAVFPLITISANIFRGLISGSIVVEFIFNIPGMGRLVYDSIFDNDWPIVFAVLFLSALLTLVGNLIADVLYAVFDPRVKYAEA